MFDIAHAQSPVTPNPVDVPDREPTAAELEAVDQEMPLVLAEVDLLDAQITAMDRPANEVDARRIRRAEHRVLAARRDLANNSRQVPEVSA
ncbi:DUF6284 family protein [Actinacidiphila paucisporea]|uniref:Uncharacterized protein n=1 Tax=Actinacidiphila paucisporea TaxID=310782 RepID=A0A1M6THC2_9ACTN|nr:DUF6284 family protein [Actinacidiphila paucisporea]SHK56178.1 hypothetical protein SAMN05216499_10141 [Actinacidiphila paucisporea]